MSELLQGSGDFSDMMNVSECEGKVGTDEIQAPITNVHGTNTKKY